MSKIEDVDSDHIQRLRNHLSNYIREETGIYLRSEEFEVEEEDGIIRVYVSEEEIGRIQENPKNSPEDLATELIENAGDIRHELVKARIQFLDRELDGLGDMIREFLKNKGWQENMVEDLFISVEQFDYPRKHWETDQEAMQGWPPICIQITDFGERDFTFPLDPTQPKNGFDQRGFWDSLQTWTQSY